MPVELVTIYEEEFYKFYTRDVIHFPLKSNLDFKDNSLDDDLAAYIIWHFTAEFIKFAVKHHSFKVHIF